MDVAIIGGGPTGLVLSAALARRGDRVVVVERDPGPGTDGRWPRRGVMQFHHAHVVRAQVTWTLQRELPEAYERWIEAGAEEVYLKREDGSPILAGTRSRRATLERAIRAAVELQPGVSIQIGHARGVRRDNGHATGVVLDDGEVGADLVIDASGRSSRVTRDLPFPAGVGAVCGMAYVDRQYRLLPGAEPGPLLNPIAWQGDFDGYQVLVFPHEFGAFSVLFTRDAQSRDLIGLRDSASFERAAALVPGLREWTDPERSAPVTAVLAGGQLRNHYRSQHDAEDRPRLGRFVSVGDAICTTTPVFGRGLPLAMMQIDKLLEFVDSGVRRDDLPQQFGAWADATMRPWVEDHMAMDARQQDRWRGVPFDPEGPLTSEEILQAAGQAPHISAGAFGYRSMTAGPGSLRRFEADARDVYRTGWRPAVGDGPSSRELAEAIGSPVRTGNAR